MHFEFPIEQLVFDFELHGNANIHISLNGKLQNKKQFNNQDLVKDKNIFTIKMLKADPKDIDSFARMTKFQINGSCYLHKFKSIEYTPEKKYHAVDPLSNNLYFGYIGTMEFEVNHENQPFLSSLHTQVFQVKISCKTSKFCDTESWRQNDFLKQNFETRFFTKKHFF